MDAGWFHAWYMDHSISSSDSLHAVDSYPRGEETAYCLSRSQGDEQAGSHRQAVRWSRGHSPGHSAPSINADRALSVAHDHWATTYHSTILTSSNHWLPIFLLTLSEWPCLLLTEETEAIRPLLLLPGHQLCKLTCLTLQGCLVTQGDSFNVRKRHNHQIKDTFWPRGEWNRFIWGNVQTKPYTICNKYNTVACSLVLNNYSIYKFNKALVPQKNTMSLLLKQTTKLFIANSSPKKKYGIVFSALFYKRNHNC